MSPTEYDSYVRTEWNLFLADPARARQFVDATADVEARRVLDVGCGSGQELIPFVERGALSIGIDLAPEVGRAGRELFARLGRPSAVRFVRGSVESLPFPTGLFDVLLCRLALPYTDNARALSEMIRVLRPSGALVLQTHTIGYCLDALRGAVRRGSLSSILGVCRVLVSGGLYHLLRRQVLIWPFGLETFQSEGLLRREIERAGGTLERRLPAKKGIAPIFRIRKV